MVFSRCPLDAEWQRQALDRGLDPKHHCPHGFAVFEVTWQYAGNLNESGREEDLQDGIWFLHTMSVYGMIPHLVVFLAVLELFIRRGTRELSFVAFVGLVTGLNEVIFKNIVKQRRPALSCLVSCGMPSGHATMAIGFLTMCLIDTWLRSTYRPDQDFISRVDRRSGGLLRGGLITKCCYHFRRVISSGFSLLPLTSWDELSHASSLLYSCAWALLLTPVPISRVAIHDHTVKQVMVGSFIGFTEAIVYCYAIRVGQHRYNHKLGSTVLACCGCPLLVHNFALPRFVAEIRCTPVSADQPAISRDPDAELQWYETQTHEYRIAHEAALRRRARSGWCCCGRRRGSGDGKGDGDDSQGGELEMSTHHISTITRVELETSMYMQDREEQLRNLRLNYCRSASGLAKRGSTGSFERPVARRSATVSNVSEGSGRPALRRGLSEGSPALHPDVALSHDSRQLHAEARAGCNVSATFGEAGDATANFGGAGVNSGDLGVSAAFGVDPGEFGASAAFGVSIEEEEEEELYVPRTVLETVKAALAKDRARTSLTSPISSGSLGDWNPTARRLSPSPAVDRAARRGLELRLQRSRSLGSTPTESARAAEGGSSQAEDQRTLAAEPGSPPETSAQFSFASQS